jgi:hypothetical protein
MRYISRPSLVVVSMPCSRNRNATPAAGELVEQGYQVDRGATDPVQAGRDQHVAGAQCLIERVPDGREDFAPEV